MCERVSCNGGVCVELNEGGFECRCRDGFKGNLKGLSIDFNSNCPIAITHY